MSMPTDPQPGQAGVVIYPGTTSLRPRHAFGWPPGSIRPLLTLMVVGLVCALMLMSTAEKPIPIPAYLLYLLFLILGHYFAAHGVAGRLDTNHAPPLHLPRHSIRFLILVALVATIVFQLVKHPTAFNLQMKASVEALKNPQLPLYVLAGFFAGVLLRILLIGPTPSPWWQDMEAWVALIATFGMGIAVLVHLVIAPSLETPVSMPEAEAILGGIVAFYFGARS